MCLSIYFGNVEQLSVFIVSYGIEKCIKEIVNAKGKCYCAIISMTIELIYDQMKHLHNINIGILEMKKLVPKK